jgi:hypothetical protein
MTYRSEDDQEYKRLQIEDPKQAITCPQCAGAGELLQPDQEYKACSLCRGIGKVVPITDKQGRPAYRTAYFITGPRLHGRKNLQTLEQRRKRPHSHFPAVDEDGRSCIALSFVPVMPGSLQEDRLHHALDLLIRLGRETKGVTSLDPAKRADEKPLRRARRKPRHRASDDDEWLPCPS